MMSVGLHCRLVGRPGRARALARFLDLVRSREQVWVCRRIDIANPTTTDAVDTVSGIELGDSAGGQAFGLVFTGYLWIDRAGSYEFELTSDDGSRLYIDGTTLVDNDGMHPPTSVRGSVTLQPGLHPLRVEYFEAAGTETLVLRYRLANTDFATLAPSALYHDAR